MSNRGWMPLDIDDYLADTTHLTAAEHGAYMLLIMRYWKDGGLPDDEVLIARYSRLPPEQWHESRDILAAFFEPGWVHKRVETELAKASDITSKRRASAKQRYAPRNANAPANAPANAEQMPSESTYTGVPPSTFEKQISTISAKRPMTEDWNLESDLLAQTVATYPGVPLASILGEAPRFRDHYLANGAEFADWWPKWRNWLRNAFPGKEVTKAEAAKHAEEMNGRVRLHSDDPVFQQIAMNRGKHPPTDREGYWTFSEDEVERARSELLTRAA